MITGLFSVPSPFSTTAAISFNITSFIFGDSRLRYERAFPDEQLIQLTGNRDNSVFEVGQATYFNPMHVPVGQGIQKA
jgi:hypothetical protein